MDTPELSKPVDAAGALFQTLRIPWQLDIDNEAAALVKIEPFTGRIRRHERASRTVGEGAYGFLSFACRQPAVEHCNRRDVGNGGCEQLDDVTVFAEHENWLPAAQQHAAHRGHFRGPRFRSRRKRYQLPERVEFAAALAKARHREHGIRHMIVVAPGVFPGKHRLNFGSNVAGK